MSIHNFLFTYSVSPVDEKDMRIADIIRKRISNLDGEYGWTKLKRVETAFEGEIVVNGIDSDAKLEQAEEKIKNILNTVFDRDHPSSKVWISVGLLVDGLKTVKEFRF